MMLRWPLLFNLFRLLCLGCLFWCLLHEVVQVEERLRLLAERKLARVGVLI